jgi:hypothetical protein
MATERRIAVTDTPALDDLARPHKSEGMRQALHEYARLISRASREIEGQFSREEWNYLADVLNGCWELWETNVDDPTTLIVAEVEDAHHLNRAGDKWLGSVGKASDKAVADFSRRLQALTPLHAYAMLASVRWFWTHHEKIDWTVQEWWRVGFRRTCGDY